MATMQVVLTDKEILEHALVGLAQQKSDIEAKMADLETRIAPAARAWIRADAARSASAPAAPAAQPETTKRRLTPTSRRKMADAQRRRWAAFHANKARGPETPKAEKRRHR